MTRNTRKESFVSFTKYCWLFQTSFCISAKRYNNPIQHGSKYLSTITNDKYLPSKYFPSALFISFIFICSFIFGQTQNLDSLWRVYNNKTQSDTVRLKAIHSIAWSYNRNNPDTAIILAEQELKYANSIPYEIGGKWIAKAYNTIGFSFTNKGNYPKALEYDLKSLKIYEDIKNSSDESMARSGQQGLGVCYGNIGIVYYYQADYTKALDYFLKSLKIREEMGNKLGIGNSYSWIGNIYNTLSNYPKALEYYFKGLKIFEEIDDKKGMGVCYVNIGIIYNYQSNYLEALNYYFKSLSISKEIGDKKGIGTCYNNMGELYTNFVNYKLALLYSDSALQISKEMEDLNIERNAYANMATIYSKTNRYKEAYENHVKFKQLTDSIFNSENSKQLGDMKTKFEVEKKETELKIKSEAQKSIAAEEKKKQQIVIYAVAGVLFLVIIFPLFLLNRFHITQRQKKVIEKQKVLVDQAYETLHKKNKEVMDSINYASRIQRALITSDKYIATQLRRLIKK